MLVQKKKKKNIYTHIHKMYIYYTFTQNYFINVETTIRWYIMIHHGIEFVIALPWYIRKQNTNLINK